MAARSLRRPAVSTSKRSGQYPERASTTSPRARSTRLPCALISVWTRRSNKLMSDGIFFFVVGPSGAGKDSLIDGAREARSGFVFARRVVTRPHGSPGEDHEALNETEFTRLEQQGGFLITWSAHGLRYGLRRDLLDALSQGHHVIANGSRAMIEALSTRVPH